MMPDESPDLSLYDDDVKWQKRPTVLADYRKRRPQSPPVSYAKAKLPWLSPNASDDVDEAIATSRYMLDWQDDWDGEGSPAYSEDTWIRATDFVEHNVRTVRRRRYISAPIIEAGADGSVDIRWEDGKRRLVISVPADKGEPAAFYGRDTSYTPHHIINGDVDTNEDASWLLLWIVK